MSEIRKQRLKEQKALRGDRMDKQRRDREMIKHGRITGHTEPTNCLSCYSCSYWEFTCDEINCKHHNKKIRRSKKDHSDTL